MVKNSKNIISILLVMVLLCQGCGHSADGVTGSGTAVTDVAGTSLTDSIRSDSGTDNSSADNSAENISGIENTGKDSSNTGKTDSEKADTEQPNTDSSNTDSSNTDQSNADKSNTDKSDAEQLNTDSSVIEEQNDTTKENKTMPPEINENDFYIAMISDEIFARMKGKSYKDDCNVPIEDLRYIHILHKDLEGNTLEGEMVCHEVIAEDLLEIFEELYLNNYPIERVELVDNYDADDETSMTANNSSCFNYRCISHTTKISKHGLGIAVDINPLYNPYTKIVDGTRTIEPAAGAPYLDREADFPYKIDENDLCYKLFIEHGFQWGGSWTNSKDYQHFELPDAVADELRAKYK